MNLIDDEDLSTTGSGDFANQLKTVRTKQYLGLTGIGSFKTGTKTDLATQLTTNFFSHSFSHSTCGQTARLSNDYVIIFFQQKLWNLSGFPGSGLCGDDYNVVVGDCFGDFLTISINRQCFLYHFLPPLCPWLLTVD